MLTRLVNLVRSTPLRELAPRLRRSVRHHLFGYPDMLVLQCVSACNLRCAHCFLTDYGTLIPDGKIQVLPLPEVKRRLEQLRPVVREVGAIVFSTFEALLHKDLFQMMDAALAINPRLCFPLLTNGQLVTPAIVERLCKYRVTSVTISLDGKEAATVEAFKTGAEFAKTLEAIRLFCASPLRDLVELVFVAHVDNIAELPDYMDFVAGLGVKRVLVSNLLTFRADLQHKSLYGKEEDPQVRALFDEAIARAKRNGQTLGLPRLTPKPKGCTQAEAFFVDIEGQVAPCDFLAVHTPFHFLGKTRTVRPMFFGNALQASHPLAIWESKEFTAFRKAHRTGKVPAPCSHCIDAYGMMCSRREFFR